MGWPKVLKRKKTTTGLWRLICLVTIVISVVGMGAVSYFSPLFSVRKVVIEGEKITGYQQLFQASRIVLGTPLMQVDCNKAAAAITKLPQIKTARVSLHYPSQVTIKVIERKAVAVVSGNVAIDADGISFGVVKNPGKLPLLKVPGTPSSTDATTVEALQAYSALNPVLARQVTNISASSPETVVFTLANHKIIHFGDASHGSQKSAVLLTLLGRPGSVYDVSAPDFPAIRS